MGFKPSLNAYEEEHVIANIVIKSVHFSKGDWEFNKLPLL